MTLYRFAGLRLWVLPDHDLKVIECFLILPEPQFRQSASQPDIEIVGLGLELLVRALKGRPRQSGSSVPCSPR